MAFPFHPLRRLTCKLIMKHFDATSSVRRIIDLRSPYRISIGKYCNINKRVVLDGRGGLTIGNCVDIAQEVNIWTEQHDYNSSTFEAVVSPVIVKDFVWIASRATILPGVTIGKGAVVACGSIVTKDVPDYTVVAGIPAKVIGKRTQELKYKLGTRVWFG